MTKIQKPTDIRLHTKPSDLIKRVMYLEIGRRLLQLAKKDRPEVFEAVVGMLLAEAGITGEKTFKPVTVPLDYRPKRDQPPKKIK